MSAPLDIVISHLPKPPRKSKSRPGKTTRAFRAECPVCQGHGQPLDLGETSDGRLLLYCHGQCDFDEVLSALGLTPGDVLPERPVEHHIPGNGGPSAWASTYSFAEAALRALEKAFAALASAEPPQGDQQFEEYLSAVFEAADQIQRLKKAMRSAVAVRRGVAK